MRNSTLGWIMRRCVPNMRGLRVLHTKRRLSVGIEREGQRERQKKGWKEGGGGERANRIICLYKTEKTFV